MKCTIAFQSKTTLVLWTELIYHFYFTIIIADITGNSKKCRPLDALGLYNTIEPTVVEYQEKCYRNIFIPTVQHTEKLYSGSIDNVLSYYFLIDWLLETQWEPPSMMQLCLLAVVLPAQFTSLSTGYPFLDPLLFLLALTSTIQIFCPGGK